MVFEFVHKSPSLGLNGAVSDITTDVPPPLDNPLILSSTSEDVSYALKSCVCTVGA